MWFGTAQNVQSIFVPCQTYFLHFSFCFILIIPRLTELRPLKCQSQTVNLWRWIVTCDLKKCYVLRASLDMYSLERRLRYSHLLTRHCPCNLLKVPNSPNHKYRGQLSCHPVTSSLTSAPWKYFLHNRPVECVTQIPMRGICKLGWLSNQKVRILVDWNGWQLRFFYYWGYQIGNCETCVLGNVLFCKQHLSHSINYIKLFQLQLMLHEINILRSKISNSSTLIFKCASSLHGGKKFWLPQMRK